MPPGRRRFALLRPGRARAAEAPPWLSTLSGRLVVALVAFVFVATAMVLGVELVRGRRQLLTQSRAALSGRARLVADRLGLSVRERQRIVGVWPQLESSQDLAVDDVDKRLATSLSQLAANFGEGTLAFGLDTAGMVVAASRPAWIGRQILDPAWRTRQGLVTRLTAPPPLLDDSARQRLLVVAAPVLDRASGRPLGTIALATPWLTLVRAAAAGIDDAVQVRDNAGGTHLVDPRPAAARTAARLWGRTVPLALQGFDVQVTDALPQAEALAPLHETERRLLLLALVVLGITAPAAAVVAGTTTRALDRLTHAALSVQQPAARPAFADVPAGAPREVHVLAGALLEMVDRLEQSRHELARQESLASLGSMAAVLAHEIRTPLAVLRGSADMLARKLAGDARGEELVSLLQEETDRLSRLARDLLVFARPRPPEPAHGDLANVALRAAGMLQGRFTGAGIGLEVATAPAPAQIDVEQLGQAVLNLLGNALEVSARDTTVRLETGTTDGRAWLRVADQGPGIAGENLERIWQPFFTTRRGGTGLGLSIVRQILDAHGGRARIETSPAGTTITLDLPEEAAT